MKNSELRIGNYVKGDTDGVYQIELSDFADWYNDHNSHEVGNHIHPIPLTEDWMLDFGFDSEYFGYVINSDNNFIITINHPHRLLFYFKVNNGQRVQIEYVHQLQNLYQCLTGEELTIK